MLPVFRGSWVCLCVACLIAVVSNTAVSQSHSKAVLATQPATQTKSQAAQSQTQPAKKQVQRGYSLHRQALISNQDVNGQSLPPGAMLKIGRVTLTVPGEAETVALSEDGSLVAASTGAWYRQHHFVWIFDPKTGGLIRKVKMDHSVEVMAASPKGNYLAVVTGEYLEREGDEPQRSIHRLGILKASTGEMIHEELIEQTFSNSRIRWSADEKHFMLNSLTSLTVYAVKGCKPTHVISQQFNDMHFTAKEDVILLLDPKKQRATRYSLKAALHELIIDLSETPLEDIHGDRPEWMGMRLTKDGKSLWVAGEWVLQRWDVIDRELRDDFKIHDKKGNLRIHSLHEMKDGQILAVARDRLIMVKAGGKGLELEKFMTDWSKPNPSKVAVASERMEVLHWKHRSNSVILRRGPELKSVFNRDHQYPIYDLYVIHRAGELWSMTSKAFLRFSLKDGSGRGMQYVHHPVKYNSGLVHPDGQRVIIVSSGSWIRLWKHGAKFKREGRIAADVGDAYAVDLSSDGKLLAVGGNKAISFWSMEDYKKVSSAELPGGYTRSMDLTADARFAALATRTHISVVDVESGQDIRWIQVPESSQLHVSWLLDGRALAAFSRDSFYLFGMPGGHQMMKRRLNLDSQEWYEHAVHPSRRWIYVSQSNGYQIIEAATGQVMYQRKGGHQSDLTSIKADPQGDTLITASEDTTVMMWSLNPLDDHVKGEPVHQAIAAEKWWDLLQSREDGQQTYLAIFSMVKAPDQAIAMMRQKLKLRAPEDDLDLIPLLAQLNSKDPEDRDEAAKALVKMGVPAMESLRAFLDQADQLESRLKALEVMKEINADHLSDPQTLLVFRCMAVLEWIRNDEAKAYLLALSKGKSLLARDQALATLERIKQYEKLDQRLHEGFQKQKPKKKKKSKKKKK